MRDTKGTDNATFGIVMVVFALIAAWSIGWSIKYSNATLPPAARPVASVDTVWMGVTHVEAMNGTVVVKFTEVKSTRHTPGKGAK